MFNILIMIMAVIYICIYIFVKIHQMVYLRCVNFIICRLYINKLVFFNVSIAIENLGKSEKDYWKWQCRKSWVTSLGIVSMKK